MSVYKWPDSHASGDLDAVYRRMAASGESFVRAQVALDFEDAERYGRAPHASQLERGLARLWWRAVGERQEARRQRSSYVIEAHAVERVTCDACGGALEIRQGCPRPIHLGKCSGPHSSTNSRTIGR
jgi:hypothetical protein